MAVEASFSDLIQHPRDTVARRRASRSRTLRLRRRGEEDLLPVTMSRAEQSTEMTSVAVGLLSTLAQHELGRSLILDALPTGLPWVVHLPQLDRAEFAGELIETLKAADSLTSPVPAVQLVAEWRHTAEVHVDPELRDLLRGTTGDFGEAPQR